MLTPSEEEGEPARIGLAEPFITGREWEYVKECLDSGWLSSAGAFVGKFEKALATRVGRGHAAATASGTGALHLALLALGVRPGDEVILPTLTFIAPANAVRYVGAHPVFVDCDPLTWQLDVALLGEMVERHCEPAQRGLINKNTGRNIVAILPVHVLGHPVDMDPLMDLADTYRLAVVEDATQSLGATYKDRSVGAMGAVGCFSFNVNKLVTTGGGGMLVTDEAPLAEQARYLADQAKDDPIEYVHASIGFNYRMSNVAAAIGLAQIETIDERAHAKRDIAVRYRSGLDGVPGVRPMPEGAHWANPVFWLYTVTLDETQYGEDRHGLMRRLSKAGIEARPLWQPLHLSAAHAGAEAWGGSVAAELNRQAVSLPSSVGLSESDQERVIEVVRSV